jgi:hypothetical protein
MRDRERPLGKHHGKHAHGMHKAARPITDLTRAHPGHAELPPRSNRAHRSALAPEAAPARRGTPVEEKVPRGLGAHVQYVCPAHEGDSQARGYSAQRWAHGHGVQLTCAQHGGHSVRRLDSCGLEEAALVLPPVVSATSRPPAASSRR